LGDSDNQQMALRGAFHGGGWPGFEVVGKGEIMREMRIAIVAPSLVWAWQSLAEVQIIDNRDGWAPDLTIRGAISKADADYVTQQSEGKYKDRTLHVGLDSEGGNVAAAMAIGRIIRRNEWTVFVGQNKKCFSSCALIYIAGVSRVNNGVIGLHRPYLAELLHREEIERVAPVMLQQVKDYVRSMGIVDSFYEQMVNTEPSQIRLYRENEILPLVPMNDPVYDEILNSYTARAYGVAAGVMRQRKVEAAQKCASLFSDQTIDQFADCIESTRWGLDLRTYLDRNNKLSLCKYSDAEQKIVDETDWKKRRDLPAVLRREACIRDKMIGP
jgi:ATP-dependent protease ClpP protease subunit